MKIIDHFLNEAEPQLHYLSYSEAGLKRPALIFLHGVTSHAHYWDELASNFSADYNVYALDWRGHGDSADAPGSYNQVESYISDLKRLLAKENPAHFALVGHSLGGYVAIMYALENDPHLDKIVVCDVKAGLNEAERQATERSVLRPPPRFATMDELVSRFVGILADSTADPALLGEIARLGARRNEDDGSYSFKYDRKVLSIPQPEPAKYAVLVNVPALVINGGKSQLVSKADAIQTAQAFPRGQHLEIAGAGHHVFLDRPAAFSEAVRHFLAQET